MHNIRPSNTESLLRIYVEAKDEKNLRRKIDEIGDMLRRNN